MKFFKFLSCLLIMSLTSCSLVFQREAKSRKPESQKMMISTSTVGQPIIVDSSNDIISATSDTSDIVFGTVDHHIARKYNQNKEEENEPIIQINDQKGLEEFGRLSHTLFRTDPNEVYHQPEFNEEIFGDLQNDINNALKESNMETPVLLSPSVLKQMIFYLEHFQKLKEADKEK